MIFDKHRAKKAEGEAQDARRRWQAQRDAYAYMLGLAQHFAGTTSDRIMLSADETIFYAINGASLIEERRGTGHYEGGSSGVSVPMGSIGGHAVRYRMGASRGHYVQGEPAPTRIDIGALYVTNKRVIFQGHNQTRECDFTKLIGFQHDDANGSTTFSVSNRQKPVTVHYGPQLSGALDFRLDLALAHFRGTTDKLVAQLESDLARIDATRPAAPSGSPG
jgi:hypothetical protein